MTEPEYVDKAVPYFNIRIMERFFGWMGLVEKKEAFIPILKINILTKMVLITVSVYMAKIEFFSFILKNLRTFAPTF